MSRPRSEEPIRGERITLPDWFLDALNEKCADRPRRDLADQINAVARRDPPWSLSAVYDFLSGKVTTKPMLMAFLAVFPDLPPPIFYASSPEEARRFQQLAQLFSRPVEVDDTPRVAETIEDTGEKARTRSGEKRPAAERPIKRVK